MLVFALALALSPAGYGVARLQEVLPPHVALTTAIGPSCPRQLPTQPESLSVSVTQKDGKRTLLLCGADETGLMYAALDTAERIRWAGPHGDPLRLVHPVTQQPVVTERAVSMYTMQRALFEQRLHDAHYWIRYFDLLAASRINSFVVIFGYENGGFLAPPYPFFFDTPGFDSVRFNGLTATQQVRNTESFRAMIRLAHERGIRVTAAIWDHIYRGGVQGGGIPGAAENAGKPLPWLISGLNADNLAPFTKAALRRFLAVFPEIDALQFRMHDESGLKPSEMRSFWHDVFAFLHQLKPGLRVDLRAKGLPEVVIDDALAQGVHARVTTKFWMEQMGLPFHPTHVNPQDQKNRRHGYADLLTYPQRYEMVWRLWTGGTARLLLWADPDYVSRFVAAAQLYGGRSVEVNEMLATHMLGAAHDAPPAPILNAPYRFTEYDFERYWDFYRVWGRATYDPGEADDFWLSAYVARFGPEAGPHVMRGVHLASRVLPRIVAAAYGYQYFPTTRGWAEMMRQGPLPKYAGLQGSDTEQFLSPRDEARLLLSGTATSRRRPEETSAWLVALAAQIDQEASAAGAGRHPELITTLTDLRILAGLARFHAHRLLAAVHYNLYLETRNAAAYDQALQREQQAVDAWRSIVRAAGDVYPEDLTFGVHAVGFPRHWKEELAHLEEDLQELHRNRPEDPGSPSTLPAGPPPLARPHVVILHPAGGAVPGRPLRIEASVGDPATIRSVRLRYRHLTQFEDYILLPMERDPRSGHFAATVPGAFIQPRWDLMYFVEVIDTNGGGRNYPDLDVAMPYVIVPVKR